MSLDEFVEIAPPMNAGWRVALITSSAVDMALYVAVIGQTIRYFYTRTGDTRSVVVQRIVNTSGLEVQVQSDGEHRRFLRQRPWDWLVILVVAIATLKAGCSLATIVLLRRPVNVQEWCEIVVSFPLYIAPFLTTLIGLLSGTFYLHRLIKLLRVIQDSVLGARWFRILIIVLIETLFFAALGLSIYFTRLAAKGWDKFAPFAIAQLSCSAVGDILVTGLTLVCLIDAEKRVTQTKRSPVRQIARITALSAAIPTITALVNLLCVSIPAVLSMLWHNLPNYALGQLFVLSLLWTLQVRQEIAHQSTEDLRQTNASMWSLKHVPRPSEVLNHSSMFARTIPLADVSSEPKNEL